MKITDVKVIIVQRPPDPNLPPLFIKGQAITVPENLVLQIHTDEGIYGEVGCIGRARGLGQYLADLVRPFLIGRTLDHREALWREMFEFDRLWNGPVHLIGS